MIHALNGDNAAPLFSSKYNAGSAKATTATVLTPNFRSSYLFLMGSVIFITGISSNSITTNTNADNLLIPIYCPISDATNQTITQRSGIPSLYMAFMKMSSFNSVTSVNRIYSVKLQVVASPVTAFQYATIITNEAIIGSGPVVDYYKAVPTTNPTLFKTSVSDFYNYLFTLRWAPYTATITNFDNILYFYYGNNSNNFSANANANCTGHSLFINSSVASINPISSKIKSSGFKNVEAPAVYDGANKKFYYLGNEFNKAIMMGLGLTTNPAAVAVKTIGAFSPQSLDNETSTYNLVGINRPSVDKFYVDSKFNPQFYALAYFCNSAQQQTY